jgi:hypothetical protein
LCHPATARWAENFNPHLHAQIERVLGHEGGLPGPGPPAEYGQLATPEAAHQVVEGVEAFPLDARHLVHVRHLLPIVGNFFSREKQGSLL